MERGDGNVDLCAGVTTSTLYGQEITTLYGRLVTAAPRMQAFIDKLKRLERSLATLLIQGESGTGKDVVARTVHERSSRAAHPFVAVNCASLDRALARSELFGHKEGAFTGATRAHAGMFEAAAGGTLFLDEVGDLPLAVQPALLRALEGGTICRVGETREQRVHVRVIAATNVDLEAAVGAGTFREDLYFRLSVVKLEVPPLRERAPDVPILAKLFAREAGIPSPSDSLLRELSLRHWPGNVRELRNAIESYAALGELPPVARLRASAAQPSALFRIDTAQPYAKQKEELVQRFQHAYLLGLLAHTRGNQTEAARISGLERSYLNKLWKDLCGRSHD